MKRGKSAEEKVFRGFELTMYLLLSLTENPSLARIQLPPPRYTTLRKLILLAGIQGLVTAC